MIWSRVTSLNGPEIVNQTLDKMIEFHEQYVTSGSLLYYSPLDTAHISNVALKRNWGLYAVILVHPVLFLLATAWKAALNSAPVGEGFGLISILAGLKVDEDDDNDDQTLGRGGGGRGVLRGATLSGRLRKEIRVRIDVLECKQNNPEIIGTGHAGHLDEEFLPRHGAAVHVADTPPPRIQYTIDGNGKNSRLRRGYTYY